MNCEHEWKTILHWDGCHEYGNLLKCVKCGRKETIIRERDYSTPMLDPENCKRCAEIAGEDTHGKADSSSMLEETLDAFVNAVEGDA